MSDHEFEKRVKQKMDELRFTPSDAVWNKVAGELRKDRPRRRGWVLLPLLAIGLGAGGYFFYQKNIASDKNITLTTNETNKTSSVQTPSGNNPAGNHDSNVAALNDGEVGNSPGGAVPLSVDQSENAKRTLPRALPAEGENADRGVERGRIVNADRAEKQTKKIRRTDIDKTGGLASTTKGADDPGAKDPVAIAGKGNKFPDKSTGSDIAIQSEAVADNKVAAEDKVVIGDKVVSRDDVMIGEMAISDDKVVIDDNPKSMTREAHVDSARHSKNKKQSTKGAAPAQSTVTVQQPMKKNSPAPKWGWGVNVSAGVSALNNGSIRDALKSTPSADAASLPQASNNALFAPAPMGVPPATASSVKSGVQFTVGGFVKKQVNKTFAVTAGLQYSQYTNVIRVGYRVDSSRLVNNGMNIRNVATYYRGDEITRFSNTYHFIEIPLTLHTQLNKSAATPLFWNAGLNFTRMIASDALLFDSGTGVYYKDDSKQNKTQVAVATGLSIGVFSKSRTPVRIGPGIRYNITSLYNDDLKAEKHLLTGSIDLRMFINKKSVQRK